MWQPEPDWERLPGGRGSSAGGVWRTVDAGRPVVVKRLSAPLPGDPGELSEPTGVGWWRREADVALDGGFTATPGLRALGAISVQEDDSGVTLVVPYVDPVPQSGLFVARALGRFAGAEAADRPWLVRDQLRARLTLVARRGGWPTLQRTPVADVAAALWERREVFLNALDQVPQVLQHGDPVPSNLPARDGDTLIGLDWSTVGRGPLGADLGYWSLSAREELDPLLEAYLGGLPPGLANRSQVLLGARVTAVYTVLTRAEWALARVADGEGALAGKFRHPSVAPSLHALQRQLPQVGELLD